MVLFDFRNLLLNLRSPIVNVLVTTVFYCFQAFMKTRKIIFRRIIAAQTKVYDTRQLSSCLRSLSRMHFSFYVIPEFYDKFSLKTILCALCPKTMRSSSGKVS